MAPFRNLLGRKIQPNGGETVDANHLSPNPESGPAPISIHSSHDGEPHEYKLSGIVEPFGVYNATRLSLVY